MPSLFDNEMLSDELAGYNRMSPERFIEEIVWTKSNHWAHELEWRVYAGRGRSDGAYEDIPFGISELNGVIFGIRMAEAERTVLRNLVISRYPHVAFFQAKPMANAYGLTIENAQF
jgi:hypothetical protein